MSMYGDAIVSLVQIVKVIDSAAKEHDEAEATHQRIAALIDTWHKSPDLRTRDYGDRLSEALDGRPRV